MRHGGHLLPVAIRRERHWRLVWMCETMWKGVVPSSLLLLEELSRVVHRESIVVELWRVGVLAVRRAWRGERDANRGVRGGVGL